MKTAKQVYDAYLKKHPKTAGWLKRDARVVSPSYTRDYPFVAESGRGVLDVGHDEVDRMMAAKGGNGAPHELAPRPAEQVSDEQDVHGETITRPDRPAEWARRSRAPGDHRSSG